MRKRSMSLIAYYCLTSVIGIAIFSNSAHAQNFPFAASDSGFAYHQNLFWYTYGEMENTGNSYPNCYTCFNGDWAEWTAMKFDWTAYKGYRTDEINALENSAKIDGIGGTTGVQTTGYVWSWADQETWPDQAGTGHGGVGSYHFDQIPRYINAVYDNYMWTRDGTFLGTMLPRAETVMDDYLLGTMQGNAGQVAIIPLASNNGTSGSRPSTYMDAIESGYKDAWTNAAFYTALKDMAGLETANGNTTKANTYQTLANAFPALYETAFWNSSTNRYAGWRDVNGTLHDYGFTYINLEALGRGLGSTTDANYIFNWLNGPAQATAGGAHTGSTSMNQDVFGPRNNSSTVASSDWDGWSNPSTGKPAYGSIVEDGGSMLSVEYWDMMAHLIYDNADGAMGVYQAMLNRMASDSHLLTFNPPPPPPPIIPCNPPYRCWDDFSEGQGEVGTSTPFPESGIAGLAFLNGFLGVSANVSGLNISPNFPTSIVNAQSTQVNYKGTDRTVIVSSGSTVLEQPTNNGFQNLSSGGYLAQQFTPSSSFNEIGVFVGNYATNNSGFLAELWKMVNGNWVLVSTRQFFNYPNNQWGYMAFPTQTGGSLYSLNLLNLVGSIAWYIDSGSSLGGAYVNGSSTPGAFEFRAVNAGENTLVNQNSQNTVDALGTGELGQTFTTTVPFNRVSLHIATYGTTNSGFTASLSQLINGGWVLKTQQKFANVVDNSDVTMNFASMPAGFYLLEMTSNIGSMAWWRNTNDVYSGGYSCINLAQVPGDRWFAVYQGQYNIQIPEFSVNTNINAGSTYIMTN